jgi:hypothetical protein
MTMAKAKAKKKNPEYKLIEKRNKRWAILDKDGNYVNGDEKVKILVAEGKIKVELPKKKEEPVEEAPAEEPTAEEAPAEEPTAEEAPAEEPTAEEAPAEEPTAEEAPAEEPAAEEKTE